VLGAGAALLPSGATPQVEAYTTLSDAFGELAGAAAATSAEERRQTRTALADFEEGKQAEVCARHVKFRDLQCAVQHTAGFRCSRECVFEPAAVLSLGDVHG
jgi:hypothetical protein